MSLRRFMELSEEVILNESFFSSHDLRDIMTLYRQKVNDYAVLVGEPHVYRILIRDSDTRLINSFRR